MQKKNYQKELDKKIEQIVSEKKVPRLFLHSCCAPCSSYVLEYLSEYFEITVFYYNPNIFPESEFEKRIHEQEKLIRELPAKHTIHFQAGNYDSEKFYEMAKGLEMIPEGGERCFRCYELRLREAARFAKEGRYDYFTTTLSISPLKNAQKLNEIGERNMEWLIWFRILKREMDISVQPSCQRFTDFTARTIVAVFIPKIRENGKRNFGRKRKVL